MTRGSLAGPVKAVAPVLVSRCLASAECGAELAESPAKACATYWRAVDRGDKDYAPPVDNMDIGPSACSMVDEPRLTWPRRCAAGDRYDEPSPGRPTCASLFD